MARAGASKFAAHDRWLAANGDALRATCRAGKVSYLATVALLRLLTQKALQGKTDQTYAQLHEAMGGAVSRAQIERALKVLTGLGVLQTVVPARSGGRSGGKGRAPVRLISFLVTAGIETDPPATPVDNQKWSRTKSEMTPHLSADPYGSFSTETPLRAANAEPLMEHQGAGKQAKREKPHTASPWQREVCAAAAESIYAVTQRTRGPGLNPEAVKAAQARKVLPHLIELQQNYQRLGEIERGSEAWYELLTVLACRATDEHASQQAWEALRPYSKPLRRLAPTN